MKIDILNFIRNDVQPKSIEEIMIGVMGEEKRYDNILARQVNQIIEKLYKKNYVLIKERNESKIDGLPYVQGATTYYLSVDGTEYLDSRKNTFTKIGFWLKQDGNYWKFLTPIIGFGFGWLLHWITNPC